MADTEIVDSRLGHKIAAARRDAGLLQYQLAELADVPQGYLSQIERGIKRPSLDTLNKLRRALGLKDTEIVAWLDAA